MAFLDSTDFEDAIRCAVSLGGDSDTLTCITGGIAEAFYGELPQEIANQSMSLLSPGMALVVKRFYERYRPCSTINNAYDYAIEAGRMPSTDSTKQDYQHAQDEFWKATVQHVNKKGMLDSVLEKLRIIKGSE